MNDLQEKRKVGRPRKELPEEAIKALVAHGYGARLIHRALRRHGYNVGLRTVLRRVQDARMDLIAGWDTLDW